MSFRRRYFHASFDYSSAYAAAFDATAFALFSAMLPCRYAAADALRALFAMLMRHFR